MLKKNIADKKFCRNYIKSKNNIKKLHPEILKEYESI